MIGCYATKTFCVDFQCVFPNQTIVIWDQDQIIGGGLSETVGSGFSSISFGSLQIIKYKNVANNIESWCFHWWNWKRKKQTKTAYHNLLLR